MVLVMLCHLCFFSLSVFREKAGKEHEVSADWVKCFNIRDSWRSGCLAYQKIKMWMDTFL